ncbi:hypothetical protein [Calidifontibacillus oryziterrae]|uniref:hypothetical protein n=1 Tax=Calidifontibacillus oryziterrae TaxID=1191699 RepID=UPI0002FC0F18|nr:hypothetical protein [Calidifontibacillus oryziterrae]
MKRTILQAIGFSALIHAVVIGYQVVHGYLLTRAYEPSITNGYDNVYYLQNEVSFGVIYRPIAGVPLELLSFVGIAVLFFAGKYAWLKMKPK